MKNETILEQNIKIAVMTTNATDIEIFKPISCGIVAEGSKEGQAEFRIISTFDKNFNEILKIKYCNPIR